MAPAPLLLVACPEMGSSPPPKLPFASLPLATPHPGSWDTARAPSPSAHFKRQPLPAQGHTGCFPIAPSLPPGLSFPSLWSRFPRIGLESLAGPWGPLGRHHPQAHLHMLLPLPGAPVLPSPSSTHLTPPFPILSLSSHLSDCPPWRARLGPDTLRGCPLSLSCGRLGRTGSGGSIWMVEACLSPSIS